MARGSAKRTVSYEELLAAFQAVVRHVSAGPEDVEAWLGEFELRDGLPKAVADLLFEEGGPPVAAAD